MADSPTRRQALAVLGIGWASRVAATDETLLREDWPPLSNIFDDRSGDSAVAPLRVLGRLVIA